MTRNLALILATLLFAGIEAADAQIVLDAGRHHLGVAGQPEWDEFAKDEPEGRSLEIQFTSRVNQGEATLLIRQRDVKLDWTVRLNDRPIGRLVTMEASLVNALAVPAGVLREGANTLSILPPTLADDIVIEEVTLDPLPHPAAIGRSSLDVRVVDRESGRGLPSRITVVDRRGSLAPVWVEPGSHLAARPGVVYTPDGQARFGVPPGDYTVYATRGFEYGLDQRAVSLAEGKAGRVDLAIRREVATPGLVACDTHVHTFTHSGHGDATIDERVVTLAGEGIELPVATDHDRLTDLAPAAERMGVSGYFTPIVGDEVTTRNGHFNAFPMALGSTPPDSRLTDWPSLLRSIRSVPGGPVIVLNHPRDIHAGFRPFAPEHFNPVTGEHRRGPIGVDAIELVNSGAMQSDPMLPFRDWMAILNHGERVTAVGASDSHDVSRYIVGQGRTYVACRDDDPARIDLAQVRRAFQQGRALVSLGLLTTLKVEDRFEVGDLATGLGPTIRVTVVVQGPSWTTVDRVELLADGAKIQEASIAARPGAIEKARITWTIPRPRHDVYLVAIATGPGVTAPYWAIPRPYQPTSRSWTPRVLGATNALFLDADGDGSWTSPRSYAATLVDRLGADPVRVIQALQPFDEAVASQAACLLHTANCNLRADMFARQLEKAPEQVRRGFTAFLGTLKGQ